MSTYRNFLSPPRLAPARDHIALAAAEAPLEAVKASTSLTERLAARRRADDSTLARLSRAV